MKKTNVKSIAMIVSVCVIAFVMTFGVSYAIACTISDAHELGIAKNYESEQVFMSDDHELPDQAAEEEIAEPGAEPVEETEPVSEPVEVQEEPVAEVESCSESSGGVVLTRSGGVNYHNGRRETWYSQRVLPGGGLDIPGRHVADDGTIRDADGYICVAASDLGYGTIVETSLGTGKVYDTGCDAGTTDIYTDW